MQLARNYLDAAFSLIQKLTSVENIIYSNYYYTYIFFYKVQYLAFDWTIRPLDLMKTSIWMA